MKVWIVTVVVDRESTDILAVCATWASAWKVLTDEFRERKGDWAAAVTRGQDAQVWLGYGDSLEIHGWAVAP